MLESFKRRSLSYGWQAKEAKRQLEVAKNLECEHSRSNLSADYIQ